MHKIILAATVAVGILSYGALAQASQGIPAMPARPTVAQTSPNVIGQSYPAFGGATTSVVATCNAANVIGQNYPTSVGSEIQAK